MTFLEGTRTAVVCGAGSHGFIGVRMLLLREVAGN